MTNNGNIVLTKRIIDNSSYTFQEIIPDIKNDQYSNNNTSYNLIKDNDGNIFWKAIDISMNILDNNRLLNTDIYYDKGRIGLGRNPLFNYRVDLSIPKDNLMTAFHIGDGSFGFSLGNGANEGFIPEIIGIGSDENDAGLYFVGIAGNETPSNIPLIIFDGRNTFGKKLVNRPILGITSGNYEEYLISVDAQGNLNIEGNIQTKDIIINGKSLTDTLNTLQSQINELQQK